MFIVGDMKIDQRFVVVSELITPIMAAVNDSEQYPKFFLVDGPVGTGKTFLYNTLLAQVRSQSQIALGLASSGIASLLLSGGILCTPS